MTVIVKHNKTNTITDWTQAQLDEQIALGNFPSGTTLANIVLPSDWNNDHTLTGLGTMAEQDATAVAITGGTATLSSVTTPSVTATTNNLTLSAISTGAVNLATAGGTQFKSIDATSSVNVWNVRGGDGSTTSPRFTTEGTGTNIAGQFNTKGTGALQFLTGNAEQMRISNTASAVNYVQVTGAATGNLPIISAQGSDSNVALAFTSKATGAIRFYSSSASYTQLRIDGTVSAVNYHDLYGGVAGNAISYKSAGSDTNISMAFQPKGTGAIDLAAGSRGVNISNGGTVTAITRTAAGSGYTTIPSVAISAPTTAGGVQATASVTAMTVNSVTIANGGTGYTVGNVLTVSGGTIAPSQLATQVTVSTVSSGVITAVTISQFGTYSVLPTNPASVTGGTGTGATFNFAYAISGASTNFTITNAGSGYIEQPTVTFSGGGGSGAVAFATIGSNTSIKTHGNYASFFASNSGSESLRLYGNDSGAGQYQQATGPGLVIVPAQSGYGATRIGTQQSFQSLELGSATNTGGNLGISFNTAVTYAPSSGSIGSGNRQFAISHTASAVNYVQVTGGTTSNSPVISAQGSDAAVALSITSKSTNAIRFLSNNATNLQFRIVGTNAAVNNLAVTGTVAGSAPILSAEGSDTNIDLTLTPKGTGLVRFGTYVAGALLATGYINIKAADGTTYKVLVST
jgi:hypothetical protein